jgi:hypothetical protein
MPTPYNGGQSPLEYYALNGNPSNGGLGRPALLNETRLMYNASFKNPQITGSPNDAYQVTHTNAMGDVTTPYRGKGTNQDVDMTNTYNGFISRHNYAGGDDFDIMGSNTALGAGISQAGNGIGRQSSLVLNVATWGYSPDQTGGGSTTNEYTHPDTSGNIGQVII